MLMGCLASVRVKFALSSIPHELPSSSFVCSSDFKVVGYWKKRLFSPHSALMPPQPKRKEAQTLTDAETT